MSYKIYAGTGKAVSLGIDEGIDDPLQKGIGYATAFQWTEKVCIFDSVGDAYGTLGTDSDTTYVTDPVLNQEKNALDTLTFTVQFSPVKNLYYDKFAYRTTKILVTEDDVPIWFGYVSSIEKQFDLDLAITATNTLGELNFKQVLFKSNQEYALTLAANKESVFSNALACGDWHLSGIVQVQKGTLLDQSGSGSTIVNGFDAIQQYLTDEYDGYLRVRLLGRGNRMAVVVDYLKDIGETKDSPDRTKQTIEYGKNLLDLTYTIEKPDNFVNHVKAIKPVTTSKGWWIFKKTETSWIEGEAKDAGSIAKYGDHCKIICPDEGQTAALMNTAAAKELAKYTSSLEPQLTIEAVDLYDAGEANDRLQFLKRTHIISQPHAVDLWLVCTKTKLPLDDPTSRTYTYGLTPRKLTDQQSRLWRSMKQWAKTTAGLVSSANA